MESWENKAMPTEWQMKLSKGATLVYNGIHYKKKYKGKSAIVGTEELCNLIGVIVAVVKGDWKNVTMLSPQKTRHKIGVFLSQGGTVRYGDYLFTSSTIRWRGIEKYSGYMSEVYNQMDEIISGDWDKVEFL